MTKALFKKQMMEVFSWIYRNRKSGKNRSKAGIVGYVLLYLLIFGILGGVFYFMADILCAPLAAVNLGWLYIAIMGLVSVALGVFGSVFNTYASLYQAKDNDLLLSLPVPPANILLVRLSGVLAMGLMYELIVMIPAVIVYFLTVPVGLVGVICTLLIPFVLSLLVLTLSAVLGWVVALVSGKLKSRNIIVVFLSLAFIVAYYYFYAHAYSMLQSILLHPQAVGDSIKSILYPLYHMGLAAQGHFGSMLIFTAMIGILFGLVYLVLSHSFLKLATANRGIAKMRYRERRMAVRSVGRALLDKELRRFLGSSNYMLNCGLGIVLMIVAAAALLVKADTVTEVLSQLLAGSQELIPLIAAAAVCLLTTMNDITAPSVSLEGKNLWLLQSFPVTGGQVLMAKVKLHLLLTLVPAAVLIAAVEWVVKPALGFAILLPVVTGLFVLFMAAFGLLINLKMPNLTWTNEIVPIKQNMGVMIVLFGGWVMVMILAVVYGLLRNLLSPMTYLICVAVLLLISSLLLLNWLRTKGARIFEGL